MKGAAAVLVSAYAMELIPRASTPAPKLSKRRAKSGRIMTKPIICKAIHSDKRINMLVGWRVDCVLMK